MLVDGRSALGVAMNVSVIGSGNGGMAVGFDWAQHGHRVTVYSQAAHADNIEAVRVKGGISSRGRLEGFAPVAYAGTDIGAAMDNIETVFVVGPAFATEDFGRDLAPHLRAGMTVVICPGSCGGALAFKRAAGLAVHDASIVVGETSTLPYAARADGEGNVQVFHKFDKGLFAAAVPRSGNSQLLATLRPSSNPLSRVPPFAPLLPTRNSRCGWQAPRRHCRALSTKPRRNRHRSRCCDWRRHWES